MVNGTWKPTTAGMLSIIAGVLGAINGTVATVWERALSIVPVSPETAGGFFIAGVWVFATPQIILGIVAILGGICALKRRKWGLALVGSICALIVWFLGIPAIIFVAMGKHEFGLWYK